MIYFSPSSEFLSSKPIWLVGVVVTVRDGKITVQFVNTTEERVTIPPDTVIACVDVIPENELNISAITTFEKNTTDWLKNIDIGNDNIGGGERQRIRELLQEYKDVFSQHENDLRRTNLIQHSIEIVGEKLRRCEPRALNPNMRKEFEKQVKDMLKNDLIQSSTSKYASPVVLVKKKDGSIRFCCDFRKLNAASRRDSYPLPRISEFISTLAGVKVFFTLDLKSGYYQIDMKPEDREKTAFTTQFGLFKWKVMPLGLCNSPSLFQRLTDLLMTGLNWHSVLVYLDNLLIFGRDYDEHYKNLREVLERLRGTLLKLSIKKCHLLKSEVTYLGHVIANGEVRPDPAKTKLIDTYPIPTNVKEVKSFVSLVSYYRKFVQNFAQIVKPLTSLLEKKKKNFIGHLNVRKFLTYYAVN